MFPALFETKGWLGSTSSSSMQLGLGNENSPSVEYFFAIGDMVSDEFGEGKLDSR